MKDRKKQRQLKPRSWMSNAGSYIFTDPKLTIAQVTLDWFQMRIPNTTQDLWVIIAETDHFPDLLVLITNRPVRSAADARAIYNDYWDGPYLLLCGIQRVLSAWSVFLAALKLPLHLLPTCALPDG